MMESTETIYAAIGIAVTVGTIYWRVASWHNAIERDLQHLAEKQDEFIEEARRNFTKVFGKLEDLGERVARLEGKQ